MDIGSHGVKSKEMSQADSKAIENVSSKDVPGDVSSDLAYDMDSVQQGENGESSVQSKEKETLDQNEEEKLLEDNEEEDGEEGEADHDMEENEELDDQKSSDIVSNEAIDKDESQLGAEGAEKDGSSHDSLKNKVDSKLDSSVGNKEVSEEEDDVGGTNGETKENGEELCAMETDEPLKSPEKECDSPDASKSDQEIEHRDESCEKTSDLADNKMSVSEADCIPASTENSPADDKIDTTNSELAEGKRLSDSLADDQMDTTSSDVADSNQSAADTVDNKELPSSNVSVNSPVLKPKSESDDEGTSVDNNKTDNENTSSAKSENISRDKNNSGNDVNESNVDDTSVCEGKTADDTTPNVDTAVVKHEDGAKTSATEEGKVLDGGKTSATEEATKESSRAKESKPSETVPKPSETSDAVTEIKQEPGVDSSDAEKKTKDSTSLEPSTKAPNDEQKTSEPAKVDAPSSNEDEKEATEKKDSVPTTEKSGESKDAKSQSDVKIKEEARSPGPPDTAQSTDATSKPAEAKKTSENEESAAQGGETDSSDAQKKASSNTRTCAECGVGKGLKYQVLFQGKTRFLCSDVCFKLFRSKQKLTQPPPSQGSKSSETCGICNRDIKTGQGFFPFSGDSKPVCSEECMVKYQQAHTPKPCCAQCKAPIEGRTKCLIWETMEFCNEDCLGSYQATMGSHCACCRAAVQRLSLGKYCVRFGADIRQFCTGKCLEEFKKGLKVCTFCQKDMSNTSEGFLAPVGDKFRDFCTSECMEQYETLNATTSSRPAVQKCSVCQKVAAVKVQVRHKDKDHQLCSDPCIAAFRYTQKIYASLCDLCHKLFNNQPLCLQYDNNVKKFCTKTCLNLFVLAHRKIVPCTWCKVKKYNFDMIERVDTSNNVQQFCSLNCLSLFRVSLNATSSRCIKCDHCHSNLPAQYHLTMSDASIRNFCSYPCVIKFQGQFTTVPTLTTVTPNLNRQGPTPVGKVTSAVSAVATSTNESTPVIANVMSLAGAAGPTPVAVTSAQKPSQSNSGTGGATTNGLSVMREVHREVIVAPPVPRVLKNKMIMCKPLVQNKGVACKPHPCHKETQTDEAWGTPVIMPVPMPMYIPSPVHMYSRAVPFPMPFPVPIPVPVFIPTTRTTTAKVIKDIFEIQEKVPSNPYEAELLLMAEMVAADEVKNEEDRKKEEAEEEEEAKSAPKQVKRKREDAGSAPDEPLEDLEVAVPAPAIILKDDLDYGPSYGFNESFSEQFLAANEASKYSSTTSSNSTSRRGTKRRGGGRGRGRGRKRSKVMMDSDTSDEDWLPGEIRDISAEIAAATPRAYAPPPKAPPAIPKVSASPSIPISPTPTLSPSPPAAVPPTPPPKPEAKPTTEGISPDANLCLKYMFGVNAWKHWVVQKNIQLEKGGSQSRRLKLFKTDLLQLTPDELNYSLCLFVKEVRKPNGEEYAPDSIYYLCLGIQMYLYENGRIDNIFTDAYYEKFTECLNDVLIKHDIVGTLIKEAHFVSRIEEEILWESKQLGAHSPQVLLNTLTYFNTKLFFLHTVDDHLQLSFAYIMKGWRKVYNNAAAKGGRCAVLRYYPPPARGSADNRKGWKEDAFTYEQEENFDNPLRCPVKLYEFYLSKCPESVRQRNDIFYMCPERSCVPDSPVWYSTQALPKESLVKMLQRISLVREISAPAPLSEHSRAVSD